MYKKLALVFYYSVIYHLPHSRFVSFTRTIRTWYISKVLKLMPYGKKSFVENNVYLSNGKNLKIGSGCQINENVFIQGAYIGNNVMIAPNVAILCTSHNHLSTEIPMINQGETAPNPPIIENDVWLGRNVVVMPGITISTGSIVAAGAVVTKNVAPFSVMGGVPAILIRSRK